MPRINDQERLELERLRKEVDELNKQLERLRNNEEDAYLKRSLNSSSEDEGDEEEDEVENHDSVSKLISVKMN